MFVYIILFALFETSYCLQCYACQSCNDPFTIEYAPIFDLPDDHGFNCTKEHTINGINRGAKKFCNANNTEQWCCQTDLCNETTKLISINGICLVVVFLIIILEK